MPEYEPRFIRNQEKTQQLIVHLEELFGKEYLNQEENEHLRRLVYAHFILDDNETGQSHHVVMNVDGPEDGMCLISGKQTFNNYKMFFRMLAEDAEAPKFFYFNASLYKILPNGETFVIH
ncbi:MAG TPA: hypothetical protein VG895_02475 [Patescibacteria group bacterium]|nr:hypothetical protein [Patescibacteria group bacterium]